MEEESLLFYCLAAPFGNGSQEPGDGQNHPPHAAGHGEEIEHHEEQSAGLRVWQTDRIIVCRAGRGKTKTFPKDGVSFSDLVVGALCHSWSPEPAGTGGVTGDSVLQQEPQEEDQGHHHVAHGVKYNRTFWVTESGDVDEESQEGEERGRQADYGHHADEVSGERQLFAREVHVGTGRWTVPDAHEGVAKFRVDFKFTGTPEAVVPLDRNGRLSRVWAGEEVDRSGVGLIAVWEPKRRGNMVRKTSCFYPYTTYLFLLRVVWCDRTCHRTSPWKHLNVPSHLYWSDLDGSQWQITENRNVFKEVQSTWGHNTRVSCHTLPTDHPFNCNTLQD